MLKTRLTRFLTIKGDGISVSGAFDTLDAPYDNYTPSPIPTLPDSVEVVNPAGLSATLSNNKKKLILTFETAPTGDVNGIALYFFFNGD